MNKGKNILIIHHFEECWIEGLKKYNTDIDTELNNILLFLKKNKNNIDKIILTKFEGSNFEYQHKEIFNFCIEHNIYIDNSCIEYGYGWEKFHGDSISEEEFPKDKVNKTWCYAGRERSRRLDGDEETGESDVLHINNTKIGLLIAEPYRIEYKSWEEIGESSAYKTGDVHKINNHTKTNEIDDICFILDIEQLLSEVMVSKEEKIERDISEVNEDLSWITKDSPIMIAEDSLIAQKHLKRIFDKVKVRIEIYDNGQLLLNALRQKGIGDNKIPLIITDLEMPVVSGHKVIQEVRNYNKSIPILVNSSMTSENNRREVMSLGATDFIGKTDTKLIISLVKKIL